MLPRESQQQHHCFRPLLRLSHQLPVLKLEMLERDLQMLKDFLHLCHRCMGFLTPGFGISYHHCQDDWSQWDNQTHLYRRNQISERKGGNGHFSNKAFILYI